MKRIEVLFSFPFEEKLRVKKFDLVGNLVRCSVIEKLNCAQKILVLVELKLPVLKS